MRALILAAGYATRMYPLTIDRPKPLLPVGGRSILDRLLDNILRVPELEEAVVVTNSRFFDQFEAWRKNLPRREHGEERGLSPRVLNDGTSSNETRLGALGDIQLALKACGEGGHWLIVAGDNLFPFEFRDVVDYFVGRRCDVITCYKQTDVARLRRTGVAELAPDDRVARFVEKPLEPPSTWAVPPLYVYREETLREIPTYLEEGNPPDAPGHFVKWLCERKPLYAYRAAQGPYDIGDLESYKAADRLFSKP